MLDISAEMLNMLIQSYRINTRVDLYKGDVLTAEDIKVSAGRVTANREQRARRTSTLSVPTYTWDKLDINVTNSRFQVWSGANFGARSFLLPLGVFRVDSVSRVNRGVIEIVGTSLESYIIEHVLTTPRTITKGSLIIDSIMQLIQESFPGVVQFEYGKGFEPPLGMVTDYDLTADTGKSMWDLVESLAFQANVEVYCAPNGKFRIAERVSLSTAEPVATFREGPGGVLVALNQVSSRDTTFNAVLAVGSSTNAEVPPVSYLAVDSDQTSSTYWGGSFGKKPKILQPDEALTSKDMCRERAEAELLRSKTVARAIDLSAIPNPALEPDDMVSISMLDGTYQNHLITGLEFPLGTDTGWKAQTLSEKDIDNLNPPAPIVPDPEPEPDPE